MKLQIKSVLKCNFNKFRCMDQGQIIHPAGNNLRILEINKPDAQFIHLHKQNSQLYDFIVSPNSKCIFTIEKVSNALEICSYNLANQRKMIRLSEVYNFLPFDLIESISLETDEFQSSVVYIICKTKTQATITLIDMFRLKVISHGFLAQFNEATVCSQQTYQISVCGRNYLRRLKAADGTWSVQQKLPKKLTNTQIFHHIWLPLGRCLMASRTTIYIVEDGEIIQSFSITDEDEPIFKIFNVAKGFIIVCQKGKIKLFGEQGEQSLYNQMQQLKLNMDKSRVLQLQYNKKSQQMFISSTSGKFYHSRLDEISTAGKQNYFHFEQVNFNFSQPLTGSITTAAGQNYCLISSEKNVQLWDMTKLCPTICLEVNNLGQDKVVKSSAINPDGHSLCIGFSDRVRFYRILLNKFRQFGEYPIKNTTLIQYSHGGQLIAVIYGKGINSCLSIVNTLNLKQVMNFKIGFKPAQAIWNQHDDELYISGEDAKVISIYQISSKSKKGLIQFESQITFIRFDYLTRKIMVSTGCQIHLIDSEHKTQTIIKPKIQDFDYVFPVQGLYIAADKKGSLYCSNSAEFDKCQHISLFVNQRFHLLYKREMLIAYSSPSDVILLKLKSSGEQNKRDISQNVVLVDKDEIVKFFDRVKLLQDQLSQLQASTSMKLDYQRKKNAEQLQQQQIKFKQQIHELQNKLSIIVADKTKQDKTNAKVFDELESGQLKNVNDLQKVYDMKLRLQKQKCLTLEQEKLQQKMKYQKIIQELRQKHNSHVEKIRKQYAEDLKKQLKEMQGEKQRYNQYRKKVETKLIDLEEEGQTALFEVQMKKDDQIHSLTQKYVKLERQYDSKIISLHNMEESLAEMTEKYQDSLQKIKRNEKFVQENINKVLILQKQIEKKNKVIEQKNSTIQQQAHQIDGLEKAKYVLSFRTTEVRKQLQPKQLLIDKLKNQMFKLDEEYKSEVKKCYDLSQRVQKLQKLNINYKKENVEMKTQLKSKERVHNDLCSEIFYIVNNTDSKEWNSSLVRIYKNYINEDKAKTKVQKKEDSTSQQINRHLIHVEQSLHQVATGNQKMLKGKQQQVIRKMKENAELVYDLNIMRKKQNAYLNDIKEKDTEISRLKRQLNESMNGGHKSTRANTANTGMTRRLASRDAANQNNSDWVDLSLKRQSDYLIPDKSRKGRVFSAHRTMAWRDDSRKQKTRISDMARDLESAKNTIMRQDRMIQELNQRLLGIPEEHLQ